MVKTSIALVCCVLVACGSEPPEGSGSDAGRDTADAAVRDAGSRLAAWVPIDAPADAFAVADGGPAPGVCDEAIEGVAPFAITLPGSGDRSAGSCTGASTRESIVRFTIPEGRELQFLRVNASDDPAEPTATSDPIPGFYLRSACEGEELDCNAGCVDCGDVVALYEPGAIPAGEYFLFVDADVPGVYSVRLVYYP
jgi:hypothetical protein